MNDDIKLKVSRVSHSFGDFLAVSEANLQIGAGEVHCLLGPSGSGKSTLLRLVAGLETLQTGQIEVAGRTASGAGVDLRPEQRAVGFVFQDYALFPHLNVRKNVLFGVENPREAPPRLVEELLERVGMSDHVQAMPHTLSGGQQQRVALARAMARRPEVMLLDEPFSGLDARLRESVRETTLDVLRAARVATLLVTHDPAEALASGDQISVIQTGKIVQTGRPHEVYSHSKDRATAEIFGPINALRGEIRGGRIENPLGLFPASETMDEQNLEGREVEILVRPDALTLASADESPDAGVKARVSQCVFEGATLRLKLRLADDVEIVVRELSREPRRVGDEVRVVCPPNAAAIRLV